MHHTPLPKPGAGGRDGLPPQYLRDKGAKRIRSLYLPWMRGVTPKLSTTTPPKGLASLFTINSAITPWRDAFADLSRNPSGADLPATAHSSRLACPGTAAGKPLPQRPSSQSLPLGEKDGQIRDRSRWFVHNEGLTPVGRQPCPAPVSICLMYERTPFTIPVATTSW
jgi:hypothetical protein